ncbi:MAG: hypothetical protein ACREJ2_11660 [Planctomycetota bacterium]
MSDTKVNVPSPPSTEELVTAAEAAAVYAKRLFLEGASGKAADLAEHAAKLIAHIDTDAQAKLKSIAAYFRSWAQPASSGPVD